MHSHTPVICSVIDIIHSLMLFASYSDSLVHVTIFEYMPKSTPFTIKPMAYLALSVSIGR